MSNKSKEVSKYWINVLCCLIFAGIAMLAGYSYWHDTNINVTFYSDNEKDINYQIFYTEDTSGHFSGSQVVEKVVGAGSNFVKVVLPAEKIGRLRLDFGQFPGTVTIKDLRVSGDTTATFTDFDNYRYNLISKHTTNEDGSLTIISNQGDPYMITTEELDIIPGDDYDWQKMWLIFGGTFMVAFLLAMLFDKNKSETLKKISRKHYIQSTLAVLLTGIFLYFTSSLWLSRGIFVSFHAQSDNGVEYKVFYTEEDGQIFNQNQTVIQNVSKGNSFIRMLLPIQKLVKFRLDFTRYQGKVVISDLVIDGINKVRLDANIFAKHDIDKYEVSGNKIIVHSNQGDPFLVYPKSLDLPAGYLIDWCRLIIISMLTFLLMLKFVQYLSKFKIEKHYSRIDIVMMAVFFALLFVPMSHISDAEKSMQENRMLAKKPQLMIDNKGGGATTECNLMLGIMITSSAEVL